MPVPRFHPLVRLILAVAGVVVAQVLLVLVVQAAVGKAAAINHQAAGPLLDEFLTSHALLLNVLACPPMIIWLVLCRQVFDRRSFVSLGLRAWRCVGDALWGALCGATAIALLFGLLYLLASAAYGQLPIISWSPDAFANAPILTVAMILLAAGAFCVLGFMEEISFRGYGFHNLVAWMGTRNAIIAQAVIFALAHLGNILPQIDAQHPSPASIGHAIWDIRWGLINIALIGIFFALACLKTGSLWFPIGFHVSWNFFQGCVSFPVSGIDVYHLLDIKEITDVQSPLLTGGTFGAEGSVLLVPIIGAMIYLLWQHPDHPQALLDLALLPQAGPEVTPAPIVALVQDLPDEETSPYAAIRTTLRGAKNGDVQSVNEQDDVPLSLGVLPRSAPVESPPVEAVVREEKPELPVPMPSEPVAVPAPLPTLPVATVPPPAAAPPAKPAPPPTPKAPTGKPPAPRW